MATMVVPEPTKSWIVAPVGVVTGKDRLKTILFVYCILKPPKTTL